MPVQVRGEVLKVQRIGAYHQLTVVAPGIADTAKPGHFVAIAVGGDDSSMLLRRAFSIYATSSTGVYGGTVEIVFAVHGKGTAWLAKQRPHDPLDVVGPLGTPFKLPKVPARCLLVGGGYGTAPLFGLAAALKERGCRVDFVMGAASQDRLFGQLEAKRIATSLALTTDDGSLGERGRVSDVLPQMIDRCGTEVVYACGPMPMLAAVAAISEQHGLPCQTAVEESMACGVGVCMTCVLPVRQKDGSSRMVRSCVEGPVFDGSAVRWSDVGTVPEDVVGAAAMGGH
jgi:dihydroorotate dehydrogenase electron transfer subunit